MYHENPHHDGINDTTTRMRVNNGSPEKTSVTGSHESRGVATGNKAERGTIPVSALSRKYGRAFVAALLTQGEPHTSPVTPAKGGVQRILKRLDSGFRRHDGLAPTNQTKKTANAICRHVRPRGQVPAFSP
jgi:hypothetical protein